MHVSVALSLEIVSLETWSLRYPLECNMAYNVSPSASCRTSPLDIFWCVSLTITVGRRVFLLHTVRFQEAALRTSYWQLQITCIYSVNGHFYLMSSADLYRYANKKRNDKWFSVCSGSYSTVSVPISSEQLLIDGERDGSQHSTNGQLAKCDELKYLSAARSRLSALLITGRDRYGAKIA